MVRHALSLPMPGVTSWQAPLTQLAPLGQAKPQLPQLAGSAVTSCSQPLAALPSQSPNPTLHCRPHAPLMHAATPLAPPLQAVQLAPLQPCAGSAGVQAPP